VTSDTRVQPKAQQSLDPDPQIRLVVQPGGIILFSAAQMHSTVPNTSGLARYSIDFRTVHLADARAFHGAPNVDSACTGTTMADYLRASDLARMPEEVVMDFLGHPAAMMWQQRPDLRLQQQHERFGCANMAYAGAPPSLPAQAAGSDGP
jgi:hypothetical protein